jgi:hypothetical protein
VGEDACVCQHTGADAFAAADPELGGGAPARADRVVGDQRMLAGRAKILSGLVDVNKGGRCRVHVKSEQARQQGRMVIAWGPPIRCQQKYPSVVSPYARKRPHLSRTPLLPRRVCDPRRRLTRLVTCSIAKDLVRATFEGLESRKLERQLSEEA